MNLLLQPSPLLDFDHPAIEQLVQGRHWLHLPSAERIRAAYDFVRNEIVFGYNASDDVPASQVLADGHGQCNTKATLFMALLRRLGLPCRLHGFTIDKALQAGALPAPIQSLAPREILHSWVEVLHQWRWIALEGLILDDHYLASLQRRFARQGEPFCGYGAATPNLQTVAVQWRGQDTFIQREGIRQDFGLFNTPDAFYAQQGVNLRGPRRWLFERLLRPRINAHVARIRRGEW